MINYEQSQKLIKILVANISLKCDYRSYLDNSRKLLLVEGSTDERFIKKVKRENVDCFVASNVFYSNDCFRKDIQLDEESKNEESQQISCKQAVASVVITVYNIPDTFFSFPSEINKWDLYGMIDSDFQLPTDYFRTPRLFITDTHDLETLLMSSDKNLLSRLKNCELSSDEIKVAYFLAYQLSIIREEIKVNYKELDTSTISCSSKQVDFERFVEGKVINLFSIVSYMNHAGKNNLSLTRVNKICNKIINGKMGRRRFDSNGKWKQSYADFDVSCYDNFWHIVNGHDILQLLRFINTDAYDTFNNDCRYNLNRDFEICLIETYDYSKLAETKLYENMKNHELINNQ